jgi:hypothetical protein
VLIGTATHYAGVASLVTSTLSGSATHGLSAFYPGTANYSGSGTGSPMFRVDPAATSAVLRPTTGVTLYGQPVIFTAILSNTQTGPVPTGSVTFYLGYGTASQKVLGVAALVSGVARFISGPTQLPAGTDVVTAVYGGTANFQPATSNTSILSVNQVATSAALSASASGTVAYGTPVTFTAGVTDPDTGLVPEGMVQFWDGTALLVTVTLNAQGKALLTKALARGSHSITAVYLGGANFLASTSGAVALTVS